MSEGKQPATPAAWLILAAILVATGRRGWQRRRIVLPALAAVAYGAWTTWHAIGYPTGWLETTGHVLGVEQRHAKNPFKNVIVRFESADGHIVDLLDAQAIHFVEQGGEVARNVPVAYDPTQPRSAMVVAEGRWHDPAKLTLAGMLAATAAFAWPARRRR